MYFRGPADISAEKESAFKNFSVTSVSAVYTSLQLYTTFTSSVFCLGVKLVLQHISVAVAKKSPVLSCKTVSSLSAVSCVYRDSFFSIGFCWMKFKK